MPPVDTVAPPAARMILGTAQFGSAYGISRDTAHDNGRVPAVEVEAILMTAQAAGVPMLDTATAYGESESVLGRLHAVSAAFDVVTKTIPIRKPVLLADDLTTVDVAFRQSLARLKCERVSALLVHDALDLLAAGGERLWALLQRYQAEGLVGHIGVSVYDAGQIAAVLARFPVEIVQLPINVFDQRLVVDGTLAELAERGIEVHARSLFLQGLLLMEANKVDACLPRAASAIDRWRATCAAADVQPLAAALSFGLGQPEIARLVIGVHSRRHLIECLSALQAPVVLDWPRFACDERFIIDPHQWSRS